MKRKVGDKVKIKKDLIEGMIDFIDTEATIVRINFLFDCYELDVDEGIYGWTEEMLEDIEVDPSTIFESLLKMQEQKDKKYGNSALKPLNVFARYHNYGSRIDEKLARVKNSEELRKNDVADIMGGIALLYKDFSGLETFREVYDSIQKNKYVLDVTNENHKTEELKIFKGKDPLGEEIDLMLLAIKGFGDAYTEWMISALFNKLILLCKNKGWTNFDDQID